MKNALFWLGLSLITVAGLARAQTTVDSPITVPLHFTEVDPGVYKLGIYVGIGSGATPALFEFDTGGVGFYAAYSSHENIAPWWGAHSVVEPHTSIENQYDSGLTYNGLLAEGAVSLFSSASSSTPLVTTAGTAQIGRMSQIVLEDPSTGTVIQTLWTNEGASQPPINGKFYGDFGMSLMYNPNAGSGGLSNLVAQLQYGPGVTAGFRIHTDASTQQAWLQIGLTAADTASSTAYYFLMNPDGDAPSGAVTPVTNLPYYSEQLFNANITIQGGNPEDVLVSAGVGMTPDTGASTTLHNTQNSPGDLPGEYSGFITWNPEENAGVLDNGLQFGLSGTTTSGETVSYFNFTTGPVIDAGNVGVQNNRPANPIYYLNTGISLFYEYDVIYNIEEGILGLDSVPEPSAVALAILGLGSVFLLVRRKVPREPLR